MARNKNTSSASKDGVVKVKAEDMVDLIGTGNSRFIPEGKQFKAHVINAEKLVAKGAAEYAKASASNE